MFGCSSHGAMVLSICTRCPGAPDPINRGSEGYFKKSRKQTDESEKGEEEEEEI